MNEARVRLAGLYEKTSKAGNLYYVGRINAGARILMLKNGRKQGDNDPDWELFLVHAEDTRGQRPAAPASDGGARATGAMATAARAQAPLAAAPGGQPAEPFDDPLPAQLR